MNERAYKSLLRKLRKYEKRLKKTKEVTNNMGTKLLWTGLTFIVAITPALKVFGLQAQEPVVIVVGAVLMFIGLFLLWQDK